MGWCKVPARMGMGGMGQYAGLQWLGVGRKPLQVN
jgi:hypothetical protein